MKNSYYEKYFNTNSDFIIPGILISIVTLIAGISNAPKDNQEIAGFATVFICLLAFMPIFMIALITSSFQIVKYPGIVLKKIGNPMRIGCMSLLCIFFTFFTVHMLTELATLTSFIFIITLIIIIAINLFFRKMIMAPTRKGRILLDKIDGLREYMSVAESDNLGMVESPMITPALFEKLLPYALALDVEHA